ncbi:MAG: cob(I)yrinic acid a,c-diamide adenosyltransferase [bacterium]|nr:cob(I)yrinic acid a,c-diamide adenosyltransferase [bacterium]
MIVINTGNGKGKTTAAIGAAVRAVGRGQRVLMVQFIKGPWKSGEDFIDIQTSKKSSAKKRGKFKLKKMGLGFVGILGDKLPRSDHKNAAKKALVYIKEALRSNKWDFIIMDEVNVAVSLKLITTKSVLDILKNLPAEKIVMLTGRGAPKSFIKRADLVTEMKEIKHPYNKGKKAIENVEF